MFSAIKLSHQDYKRQYSSATVTSKTRVVPFDLEESYPVLFSQAFLSLMISLRMWTKPTVDRPLFQTFFWTLLLHPSLKATSDSGKLTCQVMFFYHKDHQWRISGHLISAQKQGGRVEI